ncbi:tetratricopeptide repeat protein [Glycomyces sp. A-F 0318]|uniref:AfsR/SARP family transcriptional regulator n=1 Tax=Glycomyces amatae TaxID=2881355 RepID=UPI001E58C4BB|nr:BTAD domain-containing putative transcriptional regulator [Glycomyces amatae]MCD0444989.1 tetratricopeptide repeat protein [Glycomyces amatae]
MDSQAPKTLAVRVLGSLDVRLGGRPAAPTARRLRSLLVVLAMAGGEPVPVERLAAVLFGDDPPANPRRSVQTYVARLRAALGDRLVRTSPAGVRLRVGPGDVDALEFERLLDLSARAADAAAERDLLGRALALWRGDPMEDVSCEWLERFEAPRLLERYLSAVERRVDLDLLLGRHRDLAAELHRLTAAHPLREPLLARLLVVLQRLGRPAEALERYESIRRRLAEELGTDPGPELRRVHADLLAGRAPAAAPPRPPTASAAPAVVPRQLPPAIGDFIGRAGPLAELDRLLAERGDPVPGAVAVGAIGGMAGIGKTTLAVHWAHRVADRFPDGHLYVNLRGFDLAGRPLRPEEAIGRFLEALGVPPERMPSELDALVGLYRSRTAGKRLLVLLDNASGADQARPLLPSGSGSLVLVTSRDRLSGLVAIEHAHPIGLPLLTDEEAQRFLTRRLGRGRIAAEPEAARAVVDSCARLPLALAITTANAATSPGLSLAVLAAELGDAATSLDSLAGDDAAADLRAVFSWSYRALAEGPARLFRLLGLHHGPDVSAAAAASLAAVAPGRARRTLAELARAHLVSEAAPGRYALHDLLRAYAVELAEAVDAPEDRRAAVRRLLDHYVHTGHAANLLVYPGTPEMAIPLGDPAPGAAVEAFADRDAAMAWFEAEHAAMTAAGLRVAGDFDAHVWQLVWTLHHFSSLRGRMTELVELQRIALNAARRLGDAAAQAHSHRVLAWASTRLGRLADSRAQLARALELSERAGDAAGQAAAYRNLSHLAQRNGDSAEALGHSRRALELYREAGDRAGEARALNSIGWYHAQLGQYAKGRRHCDRALALCLELGYASLAANVWDSLGYIHHGLGDRDRALACYGRARDQYRELGNRFFEAETLAHLGDLHRSAGDDDAAREAWREALGLLTELEYADADQVRSRLAELDAPAGAAARDPRRR